MEDLANLFDAFLSGAVDAAILTGEDGAILALNPAFAQRLGRDDDWRPEPGARLETLTTPQLAEALQDAARQALAEPGREVEVEGELFHVASGRAASSWRVSALSSIRGVRGVMHRLEPAAIPAPSPGETLGPADANRLHLLETLVAGAPVALFDYCVSPEGLITLPFVNPAALDLFGVRPERLAVDGRELFAHIPPEDVAKIATHTDQIKRAKQSASLRYRVEHPTRGLRHVIGEGTPMHLPDGSVTYHCVALDITARHEAESHAARMDAELVRVVERLSRIAEVAPVGLFEFRIAPDDAWSFPYLSPRMQELMGLGREAEPTEVATEVMRHIATDEMAGIVKSIRRAAFAGERWAKRMRLEHPQRGPIWLRGESLPQPAPDGGTIWTGAIYDVTDDVRREAELADAHARADAMRAENERQALQDGLTGLPNRRAYDRALFQRIAAARDGHGPEDAILVRVDLDHFKNVNDTMGHEAGDQVLVRVAEVLRRTLRPDDLAARIGGDEFSILLAPGAAPEAAEGVVERLQVALAEPLLHHGRPCRFGASFGLAHTEALGEVGTELQVFADAALYRAKESGRSRLEVFTPQLHQGILADRRMAVQIQDALDRDEFVPFFQPQVRAHDRSLHGAEVLLRWPHPRKGLLRPPQFLPVAEQLRVVPRIDRRLTEKVREVLDRWAAQGFIAPRVSFNMSAGRIRDADVVESSRLLASGPTRIAMELLESTLVEEESDLFRFNLDRIREAGIDIEIDDFGSGHASIVGLTHVAPDVLKIDRRLVAPVADDPRARKMIRAILEIAHSLDIATVAEGVETEAQACVLSDLGCDVLQGYHFGAPMDEQAFLEFARAWPARVA